MDCQLSIILTPFLHKKSFWANLPKSTYFSFLKGYLLNKPNKEKNEHFKIATQGLLLYCDEMQNVM